MPVECICQCKIAPTGLPPVFSAGSATTTQVLRQLQGLICLVSLLAEEEEAEESEEESSEQEEEEENSEEEESKTVCVWMCARVSLC